jgi:TonB family protein
MLADPGTIQPEKPPVLTGEPSTPHELRILDSELTSLSIQPSDETRSAELAAEGATIFIYSSDLQFQAGIEAVAGDRYAVTAVSEWATLIELVESGQCRIMLLDTDSLRGKFESRVAQLQAASSQSVIMIAAEREKAASLMELLWQHRIHRLVIKPLGKGETRILMESAVVRYRQLRDDPLHVPDAPDDQRSPAARWAAKVRPKNFQLLATYASLAVAVTLFIGLGVVWYGDPIGDAVVVDVPGSAVITPEPVIEVSPQDNFISEQLTLAHQAMLDGRVATPAGESALDYFSAIVTVDATHDEATAQLEDIFSLLFGQAESALLENSIGRATISLDHVRRVQPENSRLEFLDRQIERARLQSLDQTELAELEVPSALPVVAALPSLSELASLLTVAEIRLQNGQLIVPAGDSALDYLRRAEVLLPGDPNVVETRTVLAEAISVTVRASIDSDALLDAEQRIAIARDLGAENEPLLQLEAELAALRAATALQLALAEQASLLANAAERLQQEQYLSPDEDSAFYYLTALRSLDAEYPGLAESWQSLGDGVAANAAAAVGAGEWESAQTWLAGLARMDGDPAIVATLSRNLEEARRQEQYLLEPAAPSEMTLIASEPLEYPEEALESAIQGTVDLEFVVDLQGNVGAVSVVAAEPTGVFEQAAIQFVSSYQYEPFVLDQRAYERILGLRVRFALE